MFVSFLQHLAQALMYHWHDGRAAEDADVRLIETVIDFAGQVSPRSANGIYESSLAMSVVVVGVRKDICGGRLATSLAAIMGQVDGCTPQGFTQAGTYMIIAVAAREANDTFLVSQLGCTNQGYDTRAADVFLVRLTPLGELWQDVGKVLSGEALNLFLKS